ncbi:hypothetical protein BUALT_Bualt11G0096200 [Buddleja alternifolia]|uniref:Cytochrome P450 n=1 Tax=Buddleja alternifolia TaxID=168488 RepID=A0AAV6X1U0_9LAMI|nr:hypothetical protein BUALT_Bualt11G0096200 [Buddleja alternifolia]
MENLNYYFLLLLVILPFVLLIILKIYLSHENHKYSPPPSPIPLPLIGHLHLIKNALHISLASLSSKYGPIFSLQLGCKSFLVISSPSSVEECFTKNDIIFANRPHSMAGDRLTYNYTALAFSSFGQFWRIMRRLSVVELFSARSLQKSEQIRDEEARALLRVLHRVTKSNPNNVVGLNYLISTYTFNHIMRIVAGKWCVKENDIESDVGKETTRRIRGMFSTTLSLGMCDFFPFLRWIGYKGMEKNLMSLHKKRDEFLQDLIDEVRGRNNNELIMGKKDKSTFIQTLLSLQLSEPQFYTDDVIKKKKKLGSGSGGATGRLGLRLSRWAKGLGGSRTNGVRAGDVVGGRGLGSGIGGRFVESGSRGGLVQWGQR